MLHVNLCPTRSVVQVANKNDLQPEIMSILHICDRVNPGQQSSFISVNVTRSIAQDVGHKLCSTRS